VASEVKLLARHRIRVLVSSDNNCYATKFGGQGNPNWMAIDDGLPSTGASQGFPACYNSNDPGMGRAWDHFWANSPGPDDRGLQDHYARGWALLASRLRRLSSVLGYDTLNEHWAGIAAPSCDQPAGCPVFDQNELTPYTTRVAHAIHTAAPKALVFGEPNIQFDYA
jgi:endoglycosylceramidase